MSRKGAEWERQFCKRLSRWWTAGERDDVFWRTSQSGGRATTRKKTGKTTYNQYGDVASTDPIGDSLLRVITFELKRGYNKANLFDLLDRTDKNAEQLIEEWIVKAIRDSVRAKSFSWALVTWRSYRVPLIWIPEGLYVLTFQHALGYVKSSQWAQIKTVIRPLGERLVWVFPLDDFFSMIEPDWIRCIEC